MPKPGKCSRGSVMVSKMVGISLKSGMRQNRTTISPSFSSSFSISFGVGSVSSHSRILLSGKRREPSLPTSEK